MEVDDPALAERLKPSKPNVATCKGSSAQISATEPAHRQRLTEAKLNKLSVAIRGAVRDQPPDTRKVERTDRRPNHQTQTGGATNVWRSRA